MDDVSGTDKEALRITHTSASELRGEVLSGPERRRRWSTEEKLRVLAQSMAPGSSPSLACRLDGISTDQLSIWRKQSRSGELTGFALVSIVADAALPEPIAVPDVRDDAPASIGVIEVELPSGVKQRVPGDVG